MEFSIKDPCRTLQWPCQAVWLWKKLESHPQWDLCPSCLGAAWGWKPRAHGSSGDLPQWPIPGQADVGQQLRSRCTKMWSKQLRLSKRVLAKLWHYLQRQGEMQRRKFWMISHWLILKKGRRKSKDRIGMIDYPDSFYMADTLKFSSVKSNFDIILPSWSVTRGNWY